MGTATRINSLLLSQYISARAGVNDPPIEIRSKTKLNIPRTAATGTAASTRINKPTIIVSAMTLLLCLSATFANESNVYTVCFFLHCFRNRWYAGYPSYEVPVAL